MLSDTYFKIIENKKDIVRLYILQIVVIIFVYFSYGVRLVPDSISMSIALDNFYTGYSPPSGNDSIWAGVNVWSRFLKPLSLWCAYPFKIIGNYNAFAFVNLIAQLLIIPYLYLTSLLITKSYRVSNLSVMFFILSPITIYHTIKADTDMQTWFLFLLTLYYSYAEFSKERPRGNQFLLLSFFCGFASLMKESGGSIIIYINLMILFTDRYKVDIIEKMKAVFLNSLLFFTPLFVNSIIVYMIYDYTYLDWILFLSEISSDEGILNFLVSFKNSFGFLIIFFIYYYFSNKEYLNFETNAIFLSSIFIFVVSLHRGRFLFLAFPIIIPLSIMGIILFVNNRLSFSDKINNYITYTFCLFVLLLNHIIFIDNSEYFGDLF